MAKLAPPNYLGTLAAPGVIRPADQARASGHLGPYTGSNPANPYLTPSHPATAISGQPNWATREGPQLRIPPPTPYTVKPNPPGTLTGIPPLGISPQGLINWYTSLYKADPLWLSQSEQLASQLGNQWTGGMLTPFEQAVINYGGPLPETQMKGLSQFAAPSWFNAAAKPGDPKELPVGLSLADILDPSKAPGGLNVLQAASQNPFSQVNLIAHAMGLRNAASSASALQRGAMHSGSFAHAAAESSYQAEADRASKAAELLAGVGSNYQKFLDTMMNAAGTQAGYTNDAMTRFAALIQGGMLLPPTTQADASPVQYPSPAGLGPGIQTGQGIYGRKPLY